ncbi:MAG: flavodoxin family protein [Candidatus Izemoplasmatales bacterium]|nr:flavodoxin family protein [Candidatus Izemoplasmatales bacterium]
MVKVFAVNGSPTMEKGDTDLLLKAFIEGMVTSGAEVELVYASRLDLKPCSCGRMYCWYDNPGNCCINDEMQKIYPKIKDADIIVLATPIYIPLPGRMQDFINRLCPLVKPELRFEDGRTRAIKHDFFKTNKFVLISVGGWWEIENFDTVVRIVRDFSKTAGVEFVKPILRPHSFLMFDKSGLNEEGKKIVNEVKKAGQQLVEKGLILPETLAAISKPLISEKALRERYNKSL